MRARAAIAAIAILGVALRVRGLLTEFWLDEIWSLRIAQEARSVADIFTTLAHDNNHPLNTLYLRLLGSQSSWIPYRLLSFASGLLLLFVLIRAGRDTFERILLAVLGSLSFPLIVYSTEARGYAPAAALATVAYVCRRREWLSAAAIAIAMVAHLTAVYVWIALLVSDAVKRRRIPVAHVLPAGVAGALYLLFVRHLYIGGGPPESRVRAAIEAAAKVAGGNGIVVAVICVIATAIAIRRSDDALFFTTAIFVAPAAAALMHGGEYMSWRYFFVAMPFVLILLASLARFVPRQVVVALAALWVLGTILQLTPFLRYGRGSYIEALQFIGRGDVSGDNDFRNGTMIDFYARGRIHYHPEGDPQYARTEWFLIESFERTPRVRRRLDTIGGVYTLAGVFRFGGVSGWNWLVYRRVAEAHP